MAGDTTEVSGPRVGSGRAVGPRVDLTQALVEVLHLLVARASRPGAGGDSLAQVA